MCLIINKFVILVRNFKFLQVKDLKDNKKVSVYSIITVRLVYILKRIEMGKTTTALIRIIKELKVKEKKWMLAAVAAHTFERGIYFIDESELASLLANALQTFPKVVDPDGEIILKSVEAQHGILVERARRIHSFSHLTVVSLISQGSFDLMVEKRRFRIERPVLTRYFA